MSLTIKNIFLSAALSGILTLSFTQELYAQETQIYPITNQMVTTIQNAPNAAAAVEALCQQGGPIRGSGFNAGSMCSKQDFARVARVICEGYVNGKDSFKGSNCDKNAIKVGITDVQRAADAIKATVEAKVSYLTNSKLLVCGPESLGADGVAQYRAKLPATLKKIADVSCGSKVTPSRPTSSAPPLPKEAAQKIIKQDVAYMDELRRVLQEGVKLKPVRGRLNSVAKTVPIEGEAISIPSFTIPEVKSEAERSTLIKAAQDFSDALKGLSKAIDQGDTVSQADLEQASKIKESLENAKTSQDVVKALNTGTNEVVKWSSGKAERQKMLEQMRQQGGLFKR